MFKAIKTLVSKAIIAIGSIHWKANGTLSEEEKDKIRQLLKDDYYIILTRRSNHLSTYFIDFIELFLSGKFGFWSHALMNLEDEVTSDKDFRLMEATSVGVHYSEFDNVFDVQSAVLLKPKNMTIVKWTSVLDDAKAQLGKPYDTLFNIADDSKLSCIELVRQILSKEANYSTDFANFEAMIQKSKNVSPQMLYDCIDFEVFLEYRK